MSKRHQNVVDLTPSLTQQKTVTGREDDAGELRIEPLEERIAPLSCSSGGHFPEAK